LLEDFVTPFAIGGKVENLGAEALKPSKDQPAAYYCTHGKRNLVLTYHFAAHPISVVRANHADGHLWSAKQGGLDMAKNTEID